MEKEWLKRPLSQKNLQGLSTFCFLWVTLTWNLVVTSIPGAPTQDAIVDRAADLAAAAIEMRKAAKCRTNIDNCRAQGIVSNPLLLKLLAGGIQMPSNVWKIWRVRAREDGGKNNSEEIKFFFQRLSVSLQRGNAALLIERNADAVSV